MIARVVELKLFTSQEEIMDFFMYVDDTFRPMKQPFSADFVQRWLALNI